MAQTSQIIGRLPVWKGHWVAGARYKAKNRVSYLGSEFQAKREGVLGEPVRIIANGQGYTFNTADWDVISNGTEAYILNSTINRVFTVTETAWAAMQSDAASFSVFCQNHKGWAVDVVEDGYVQPEQPDQPEPAPEGGSSIAADGTLSLDAVISADGTLSLNATIAADGALTL